MAHKPFLQFLSYTGKDMRSRLGEYEDQQQRFTLTFVPEGKGDPGTACEKDGEWFPENWHERGRGRVQVGGPKGWAWRCK